MPQYGMVIPSRTDSIGIVHHSPLFLLQKKRFRQSQERRALCFVILLLSEENVTCPCLCLFLVLCLSDLVAWLVVTRGLLPLPLCWQTSQILHLWPGLKAFASSD